MLGMAPFKQLIHGGISVYTPLNSLDKNVTLSDNNIFIYIKLFTDEI